MIDAPETWLPRPEPLALAAERTVWRRIGYDGITLPGGGRRRTSSPQKIERGTPSRRRHLQEVDHRVDLPLVDGEAVRRSIEDLRDRAA